MPEPLGALDELLCRPASEREARGYLHTAAEIASQPAVWRKTAEVVLEALPGLRSFCAGSGRILLTGAGSSYYAALGVASLVRATFPVAEAIPSTEIVTDPESSFPRERFLLVSLARSGDSPESNAVVALAEQLRGGSVRHLAITCNRSGALARMVAGLGSKGSVLLLPPESNDRGLAMTSSVTSLIIAGYALAYLDSPDAYRAIVEGLAALAVPLLDRGSTVAAELAAQQFGRMFFIASRPFTAGAQEAHLKVQELTGGRIIAKAEDTLGFRHGFMAAVDDRSLVVLYLSGDPYRRGYELDLLAELRAKGLGRKILLVTDRLSAEEGESGAGAPEAVLAYGTHDAVKDAVRSPLIILPGQLLGLFCSLELGFRPDSPSPSGVISRVVQGVRIHPYGKGP